MKKRVLITGGSGFLGTNLVDFFIKENAEVINIDGKPPRLDKHASLWKGVDILDADRLKQLVHDFSPNYVFHLAARTDLEGAEIQDYKANTDGVRNLTEALIGLESADLKRVVYASSMLVCKLGYLPKHDEDYCPNTAYGESKVEGEKIVKELAADNFCWSIVRPTSLWGPWFDVPYKNFFNAVRDGYYLHPKKREVHRSYGFVLNSVFSLNALSICQSEAVDHQTFYLADYKAIEIRSWANMIANGFNARLPFDVPLGLLRVAALLGDVLKLLHVQNPPLTSFRLNNMLTDAVYDLDNLQDAVGKLPYTIEEGVNITVDWMQRSIDK